jgi:hypothetical protein
MMIAALVMSSHSFRVTLIPRSRVAEAAPSAGYPKAKPR